MSPDTRATCACRITSHFYAFTMLPITYLLWVVAVGVVPSLYSLCRFMPVLFKQTSRASFIPPLRRVVFISTVCRWPAAPLPTFSRHLPRRVTAVHSAHHQYLRRLLLLFSKTVRAPFTAYYFGVPHDCLLLLFAHNLEPYASRMERNAAAIIWFVSRIRRVSAFDSRDGVEITCSRQRLLRAFLYGLSTRHPSLFLILFGAPTYDITASLPFKAVRHCHLPVRRHYHQRVPNRSDFTAWRAFLPPAGAPLAVRGWIRFSPFLRHPPPPTLRTLRNKRGGACTCRAAFGHPLRDTLWRACWPARRVPGTAGTRPLRVRNFYICLAGERCAVSATTEWMIPWLGTLRRADSPFLRHQRLHYL